jgi:dTDP-4-dehydrorhamnose reductase
MSRIIFGDGKVSKIIRNENDIIINHSQCDITNYDSVDSIIKNTKANVVINAVAKTNLEYCQINKSETYTVNVIGTNNLLISCAKNNKKFVHISSGCLFDGNDKIIHEDSPASPAVWYTWTKLWADQFIENYGYEDYLILRPRQLISSVEHPTNMLTKFMKMSSIAAIDEQNSLTCIEDLSMMIDHLLSFKASGIYNCANSGTVSPYWMATELKNTISPALAVSKISYNDFLLTLKNKRVNTILSTEKIEKIGYKNRSAEEAVRWCIENYKK